MYTDEHANNTKNPSTMPISWLNDNLDILDTELTTSSLINKFKSSDGDIEKESYDLIVSNRLIASQLLRSFSKLHDAFLNLNLRFGWIDSEKMNYGSDAAYVGQENTIVIGEGKYINSFMKVRGTKTLILSNKTQNDEPHLGFQRHLAEHKNPNSVSLGELMNDLEEAETTMRTAENIFFHMDVMKKEDSGVASSHSAGLDIFSACKLMRLAGLSKQLNTIGINTETHQISEKTADMVSLLVWYFFEGQINKHIETMKQKENDIFLVSSEMFEEPIKFVVGHKTGRWWYQHPATKEYVPCSDKDYKAIAVGSLPDTLVALQN